MTDFTEPRPVDTNDCWLWAGYVTHADYGRHGKHLAHRLVYESLVGEIPKGLELDHLCKTQRCVNPEHLEPVTTKVNGFRRRNKVCRNGHQYTPDNEYWYPHPSGIIARRCRACNVVNVARYNRRKAVNARFR